MEWVQLTRVRVSEGGGVSALQEEGLETILLTWASGGQQVCTLECGGRAPLW